MNRLKYRRNHSVNGIENRAEKVVDSCPNGGEEILNRCKYGRCHRLNGSDNGGEGVGIRDFFVNTWTSISNTFTTMIWMASKIV